MTDDCNDCSRKQKVSHETKSWKTSLKKIDINRQRADRFVLQFLSRHVISYILISLMVTVVRHFMSTVVSHKLLFYRNFRVNREINTIILSTFLQTVIFKCIHVNYPIVSSRAFPEDVGGGGALNGCDIFIKR